MKRSKGVAYLDDKIHSLQLNSHKESTEMEIYNTQDKSDVRSLISQDIVANYAPTFSDGQEVCQKYGLE
jgi:hypothetical protein